jgi:hypothetical protein
VFIEIIEVECILHICILCNIYARKEYSVVDTEQMYAFLLIKMLPTLHGEQGFSEIKIFAQF